MASEVITVTKILKNLKHNDGNCVERMSPTANSLGSQKMRNQNVNNENVDYYGISLPSNDSKFLAPIRRWEKRMGFVTPIRWINVFLISWLHVVSTIPPLYYFCIGMRPMWQTVLFELIYGLASGFGVTAGAHRYWTHRSFKAKLPLQIILMIFYSIAGQNTIPQWVIDHRVHHKMSETSADPHDSRRGFFFSHVGWLMMKKHPHVIAEGKKIDMSDITNDPVIKFHSKYFAAFKIILCFVFPILTPVLVWGESWELAVLSTLVRYMISLNCTWSVNSFAHIWGNKPYDINITPVENWKVSIMAMGEGWHNYHHTFPWDYKAAELAYFLNISTWLIDAFASIGWAYDLKKASPTLIANVVKNRGPDSVKH